MKEYISEKKFNWRIFLVALVAVTIAGFIGSLFTINSVSSNWFQNIKPSITPGNAVFGIIWPILYLLIALSFTVFWKNCKSDEKSSIVWFYIVNLIFNILWPLIFFGSKEVTLAFFDLVLIWISTLYIVTTSWKYTQTASLLLLPYLIWLTFAGILNLLML